MAPEQSEHEREIQVLESELKRLEAEYNMFFAGRLPRPPWETRTRVTGLFKKFDRIPNTINNYAVRFRFQTLQSRFTSQIDLWDRGLRSREEGRAGGPFAKQPKTVERAKPAKDRVIGVTTLSDPSQEMDKVQELYTKLVEARREAGQEGVPFAKFSELVKKQVGSLRMSGSTEVAFRVALKDGKVAFTARAMKDGKDED
jgi:hypothetical protein